MILVTGATGNVGAELVTQLAAEGRPVRAMTRRPDKATVPPGVEVVHGDADDADSLDVACRGVERMFLMSGQAPGSVPEPTHDQRLVHAARRAGVEHVVKLSVYQGGSGDDILGRWHRAAEGAVTSSGVDWTMLRPGRFMSNALQWRGMLARGDTIHVPFAHRPAASIDPADIAAVARVALTTDTHRNRAYRMSGPEALSPAEELDVLAEILGRDLRLVEPSMEDTRAGMIRSGMSEELADTVLTRYVDTADGTEVLPTVAEILGRPPSTFRQWAHAHTHLFTGGNARHPQHT